MPQPLLDWLVASWALLLYLAAQPYAPFVAGAGVGGWSWGTAKNRTALGEIGRGLFFGLLTGGAVWMFQQLVLTGGA